MSAQQAQQALLLAQAQQQQQQERERQGEGPAGPTAAEELAQELGRVQAGYAAQLEELRRGHAAELQQLRAAHAAELAAARAEAELGAQRAGGATSGAEETQARARGAGAAAAGPDSGTGGGGPAREGGEDGGGAEGDALPPPLQRRLQERMQQVGAGPGPGGVWGLCGRQAGWAQLWRQLAARSGRSALLVMARREL